MSSFLDGVSAEVPYALITAGIATGASAGLRYFSSGSVDIQSALYTGAAAGGGQLAGHLASNLVSFGSEVAMLTRALRTAGAGAAPYYIQGYNLQEGAIGVASHMAANWVKDGSYGDGLFSVGYF